MVKAWLAACLAAPSVDCCLAPCSVLAAPVWVSCLCCCWLAAATFYIASSKVRNRLAALAISNRGEAALAVFPAASRVVLSARPEAQAA